MSDYKQPEFYRFNSDSIDLINFVKTNVKAIDSLLDLGTGSGILGIELARFYKPQFVSFVELQEDFREFLVNNINDLLPTGVKFDLHFKAFSKWGPERKFDVIVCNPPYYLDGHGQLSNDLRRAKCRSFMQDNWIELLQSIERSLTLEGRAFLVIKNEKVIIKEVEEMTFKTNLELNILNHASICFLTFRLNKN